MSVNRVIILEKPMLEIKDLPFGNLLKMRLSLFLYLAFYTLCGFPHLRQLKLSELQLEPLLIPRIDFNLFHNLFFLLFFIDFPHFLLLMMVVCKKKRSKFFIPKALKLDDYATYYFTVPYVMALASIFLAASIIVQKLSLCTAKIRKEYME